MMAIHSFQTLSITCQLTRLNTQEDSNFHNRCKKLKYRSYFLFPLLVFYTFQYKNPVPQMAGIFLGKGWGEGVFGRKMWQRSKITILQDAIPCSVVVNLQGKRTVDIQNTLLPLQKGSKFQQDVNNHLPNSMEQSPPWEANRSFAGQEISLLMLNYKASHPITFTSQLWQIQISYKMKA